jgi:hypothetical protein
MSSGNEFCVCRVYGCPLTPALSPGGGEGGGPLTPALSPGGGEGGSPLTLAFARWLRAGRPAPSPGGGERGVGCEEGSKVQGAR